MQQNLQQNWNTMLTGMADANQKAVEAASELQRIAARTQGLLARRQLAAFEDCLDAGGRMLGVTVESSDPKQVFEAHTQLAVQLGEKLVAAARESVEIQAQARDELVRWLGSGMQTLQAETATAIESVAPQAEAAAAPKPATAARKAPARGAKKQA